MKKKKRKKATDQISIDNQEFTRAACKDTYITLKIVEPGLHEIRVNLEIKKKKKENPPNIKVYLFLLFSLKDCICYLTLEVLPFASCKLRSFYQAWTSETDVINHRNGIFLVMSIML